MKSLRQVLGRQPYRFPRTPNQKSKNQGAKRNLIPLTRGQAFPSSFDIGFSISHPPLPRNVPTGSFLTYGKWRKIIRMSKSSVFGQTAAETRAVLPAFLQDCFSFHSKCATIRPSNLSI